MVICLERGAVLHMAQLMPLPLTISCSSKIQIGFTFLVPAHPGSPGQRAIKRVCVCVCVCIVHVEFSAFIALTLLVWCQEEHLAYKNLSDQVFLWLDRGAHCLHISSYKV